MMQGKNKHGIDILFWVFVLLDMVDFLGIGLIPWLGDIFDAFGTILLWFTIGPVGLLSGVELLTVVIPVGPQVIEILPFYTGLYLIAKKVKLPGSKVLPSKAKKRRGMSRIIPFVLVAALLVVAPLPLMVSGLVPEQSIAPGSSLHTGTLIGATAGVTLLLMALIISSRKRRGR